MPASPTYWRLGALLWGLCFQFFIAEQLARSAWTIPYSWSQHMISDLGAVTCGVYPPGGARDVCSPWHAVMNTSLVIQGLLIGMGALLLRQRLAQERIGRAANTLFLIAGLSLMVVGIVPEDVGSPLHVIAAAIHLVCGNLALILLGISLRPKREFSIASWVLLTLGCVGLTAVLLLGVGQYRAIGPGAMERIGGYPLPLLLTGLGLFLFARYTRK